MIIIVLYWDVGSMQFKSLLFIQHHSLGTLRTGSLVQGCRGSLKHQIASAVFLWDSTDVIGYFLIGSLCNSLSMLWFQQYVFDYRDGDVFGCVADIGWITGHSYVVYGPLCNGATTVLFESTPVYPNPGEICVRELLRVALTPDTGTQNVHWLSSPFVYIRVCSGRYWEMVERLRINQFYGAPTALRLLLKYDENWVKRYDRSSLQTLGSGNVNTHA